MIQRDPPGLDFPTVPTRVWVGGRCVVNLKNSSVQPASDLASETRSRGRTLEPLDSF